MKNILSLSFSLVFLALACTTEEPDHEIINYNTHGPANGSLVIVGGAMRDTAIADRFIELAGGLEANIVMVPTASGEKEINEESIISLFTSRGAVNVKVLHTYDPEEADSEEFAEILKEANGVWFGGGRQWRIVDSYAGTVTEEAIRAVLDRGGVIGGSSAGATIQGSYLARGDTKSNTIMMGDHEVGFSYLSNSAIDQHVLVRNRQHDLVEIISAHPNLLGIGLDENTAIVVQKDEFEVIGNSFVAIYDYSMWGKDEEGKSIIPNGGKFFLLRQGDKYNVSKRQVVEARSGSSRNFFGANAQQSE